MHCLAPGARIEGPIASFPAAVDVGVGDIGLFQAIRSVVGRQRSFGPEGVSKNNKLCLYSRFQAKDGSHIEMQLVRPFSLFL